MKVYLLLVLALALSLSTGLVAQDLSKSRVALVGFTGGINEDILNGLDPRNTTTKPYTPEENDLQARINKRLEKLYLDDAFDSLQKQLEEKGIQLEPLSTSDKVASLNEMGYPNPLIPKNVIKKKNEDYADYFLNIQLLCSKPILGGMVGFKAESRIKIVLYDGTGKKIKTINEEVKDSTPIKNTDFDEEWTMGIDRFNRMDWYNVFLLEERLLPLMDGVIKRGLAQL